MEETYSLSLKVGTGESDGKRWGREINRLNWHLTGRKSFCNSFNPRHLILQGFIGCPAFSAIIEVL